MNVKERNRKKGRGESIKEISIGRKYPL